MPTCPIWAGQQYTAVGAALDWAMMEGYPCSRFSQRSNTAATPAGWKSPTSAPDMTNTANVHARYAGKRTAFTMHSIRVGRALKRTLGGKDLSTVMQRAFWKKPRTAWRCLRFMEVMLPGTGELHGNWDVGTVQRDKRIGDMQRPVL